MKLVAQFSLTNNKFLLRSTEFNPQMGGMVDRQLLPPFRVRGGRIQRSIVAGLSLPFAVEIIGHDVDEVQVAGNIKII